jgi:hypothetical protein
MPRFGIKSLLILLAVVGLLLSTSSGYTGSQDIRAILLLLIFLTAGLAALFYRGRRQAFWIGFVVTMLIMGSGFPREFVPGFAWVGELWTRYRGPYPPTMDPLFNSSLPIIRTLAMIGLSAISGCLAVYIFDRSRSQK